MASTTHIRPVPASPKRSADRKTYAAAVLSGIYASNGRGILNIKENHDYEKALRSAKKVAFDQADEMLKASAPGARK